MALQRLSEEGWRRFDSNKLKCDVSTASRLMGGSHIYDSVCYSSASLSVTLTQLHSVRGKENKVETERWEGWGRNRERNNSQIQTDKNKNSMKSEPEKKAVFWDLEKKTYDVLHQGN